MRTTISSVALLLTAAATVLVTAPPASAADKAVCAPAVTNCATATSGWQVRGTWDDSVDTLCVSLAGDTISGYARIVPVDGVGPSFRIDGNPGTRVCTGNLSIPEDHLYRMTVFASRGGGLTYTNSGKFYT